MIGSPSSTTEVTLNLLTGAYRRPVYGQLVGFRVGIVADAGGESRTELALGTVTKVVTVNPSHSASAVEAYTVAERGTTGNRTGDSGDVRTVEVGVEAVFRLDADNPERGWVPAGSTLANSPATGTPVQLVDQTLVDVLMARVEGCRYLGRLRGSHVLVPFTEPDFSGSRGSRHGVIAGATGSGKTATAAYRLATDLAHDRMGQIILDPQGQWASEIGMTFSLQGLAAALGRQVTVARLSRSLRLSKDAPMFLELLARAEWFQGLSFGSSATDQINAACRVLEDALDDAKALTRVCGTKDWTEADPAALMVYLLTELRDALPSGTIYAGSDGQKRIAGGIRKPTPAELVDAGEAVDEAEAAVKLAVSYKREGVLDQMPTPDNPLGGKLWRTQFVTFSALLNLWSPYTPEGAWQVWQQGADPNTLDPVLKRKQAWFLLRDVFAHDETRPAPWLILDLSTDPDPRGASTPSEGDEETQLLQQKTRLVLDQPGVKARILRQLANVTMLAGQEAFRGGKPLNCRIVVEEASLYAAQPDATTDKAVAAFSDTLVDMVERARKLGIGLWFILQSISSLRDQIWRQCTTRVCGYGMTEQADLKRLSNVIGDAHTNLYRSVSSPEASGKYTFLFSGGGLTGLSFGPKPVFLDILTDPDQWLVLNADWIAATRRRWPQHLPKGDTAGPLIVMPGRPAQDRDTEHRYKAAARLQAAGNTKGAQNLLAGAAAQQAVKAAQGGFGWGAKAQPVTLLDDEQPPF